MGVKLLLSDKNIIITGSGRGIGKALALVCAKEGANVGITSRTLEELIQVKEEIKLINPNVKIAVKTADITNYEEVEEMLKYFYQTLGKFNGVIANAGTSGKWDTHEFDKNKFQNIINVNVLGVFYTIKGAYPYLLKDDRNDKARFIITGSNIYFTPLPKFAAYTASKYAIVGLQRVLALEYRRENINVNMVLPTLVDTRLYRGKNAGNGNLPPNVLDPIEIIHPYIFLLSDESNNFNNELIDIGQFEVLKRIIKEVPDNIKETWQNFKEYLEENKPILYSNIKKQWKLARFLLKYIK